MYDYDIDMYKQNINYLKTEYEKFEILSNTLSKIVSLNEMNEIKIKLFMNATDHFSIENCNIISNPISQTIN